MRLLLLIVFTLLCHKFVESADIHYNFVVKTVIHNPDGHPLPVIGVFDTTAKTRNPKPFPGPLIRATIGDTLHVNLKNDLRERTSLHMHGLHMLNNVWMDGVMGITECGIAPGSNFTYTFELTQTGTYWYHAHNGVQYGDGLFGPLVVDYKKGRDPVLGEFGYRVEHIVVLQDWLHEVGNDVLLLYSGPYDAYPRFRPKYPWPPQSHLINGVGQANCAWDDCTYTRLNISDPCYDPPQCFPVRPPYFGQCDPSVFSPLSFHCPAGEWVRLRLINAASNLPSRFWIDRHNLVVVGRDGVETNPKMVEYVTIPVAQRLDVVVRCDQDPAYKYYMYSTIPASFIPKGANLPNVWTYAFLTYSGDAQQNGTTAAVVKAPLVSADDRYLNRSDSLLFEYHLKPREGKTAGAAARRIFLLTKVAWNPHSGPLEQWTVNNITFLTSRTPLLPGIYAGADMADVVAHEPGVANNTLSTHIIKVKYGETVEIVVAANDQQQHPWHLHGQWVDFVGAGFFTANGSVGKCGAQTYQDLEVVSNVELLLPPYDEPAPVIAVGDSFTVPGIWLHLSVQSHESWSVVFPRSCGMAFGSWNGADCVCAE